MNKALDGGQDYVSTMEAMTSVPTSTELQEFAVVLQEYAAALNDAHCWKKALFIEFLAWVFGFILLVGTMFPSHGS